MAAVAAHALATGSEAALLAGKPAVSAVQANAADSPFAAVLAQMMSGPSLQGASPGGSSGLPDGGAAAGQPSAAAGTGANQAPFFSAILPGSVPSYVQSLGASQSTTSAIANTSSSRIMAAFAQSRDFATAQPDGSAASPGSVSAGGSAVASATAAPALQLAANLNEQNLAQQAASTWLQQMMTAARPAVSSPTANALSSPAGSQQTSASVLQQMVAANAHAGTSSGTAASGTQVLPPAISSYAQTLGGTTAKFAGMSQAVNGLSLPSDAQQRPASLLQQMISASANISSSSTQSGLATAPNLPAGVSSYGQSMNAVPPLFADISAAAVMAAHASGMPQLQSLAPSTAQSTIPQVTQTVSLQSPAAQTVAPADAGPWPVASPLSTILSAGSTQSVAAMFGVPTFPAAMAFAAPNSGKSQSAVQGGAGSLFANASKNAVASGTATTTPSGNGAQAAQPTSTQSAQSAANQTQSTGEQINKAATLAEAAESSVRQGHSAPVTEAQTLPFDLADAKAARQDSARATTGNADEADETEASPTGAGVSQAMPSVSSEHSATTPSPAPSSQAATDTTAPPAPALVGVDQAAAGSTQQGPQAANTLPAPLAATPPPAPDLNQLALSIASKSADGTKQFDIRLDPAELGRVDVRLSVDSAGTAQAHLAAERPETLALLQSNAPTLTRALQDSGVQVASNGLQFSLKGQERQTDGEQRAPSRNRGSAVQSIAATGASNSVSSNYSLSPAGEGVNILV